MSVIIIFVKQNIFWTCFYFQRKKQYFTYLLKIHKINPVPCTLYSQTLQYLYHNYFKNQFKLCSCNTFFYYPRYSRKSVRHLLTPNSPRPILGTKSPFPRPILGRKEDAIKDEADEYIGREFRNLNRSFQKIKIREDSDSWKNREDCLTQHGFDFQLDSERII